MPLPAGTLTVAQVLKDAGYATACIGKWGMGMFDTTGSPLKIGFDHFFGYNCQRHAHSYFPTYLYRDDQRFELPGNDGKGVGKTYAQNLIADETLDWVRKHKDRPFFLFYSVTLPHGRFEIDDLGHYAETDWTPQQKNYAAMVTRLDSDVGRLLDLLKELQIDDNTHRIRRGRQRLLVRPDLGTGPALQPGGQRPARLQTRAVRRRPAAGGHRPLAGRGPGGPRQRRAVGVLGFPAHRRRAGRREAACQLSSRTASRSCRSSRAAPRPSASTSTGNCTSSSSRIQAVRFGDWKAVRNGPSSPIELYDLKTDPGETKDLAGEKPDLVARAEALMKAARTEDPNWPLRDRPARKPQQKQTEEQESESRCT